MGWFDRRGIRSKKLPSGVYRKGGSGGIEHLYRGNPHPASGSGQRPPA